MGEGSLAAGACSRKLRGHLFYCKHEAERKLEVK